MHRKWKNKKIYILILIATLRGGTKNIGDKIMSTQVEIIKDSQAHNQHIVEYVDEVLDESSYDDDYAEMLYSNANEVKDAIKGITSTGCVITNNELHILSVYPDNKPVMGFWDKYNNIEYVFGLKIYGETIYW